MKNYYKTLEIHPQASMEVMSKAYRTLVHMYHPDRYQANDRLRMEAKLRELNEAYETLSQRDSRMTYDKHYYQYQQQSHRRTPVRPIRQTRPNREVPRLFYAVFLMLLLMAFSHSTLPFFFMESMGKLMLMAMAAFTFYWLLKQKWHMI